MTRVFRRIAFSSALAVTLATNATAETADPIAAKLCPILAKILTDQSGAAPEFIRGILVMAAVEAYDYDHDELTAVQATADAATTATCPDDRDAVLKATNQPTLADAMR